MNSHNMVPFDFYIITDFNSIGNDRSNPLSLIMSHYKKATVKFVIY